MDYGITRIYAPDDGREMGLQGMINDLVKIADTPTPPLKNEDKVDDLLKQKDVNTIARLISLAENRHEDFQKVFKSNSLHRRSRKGLQLLFLVLQEPVDQENPPLLMSW